MLLQFNNLLPVHVASFRNGKTRNASAGPFLLILADAYSRVFERTCLCMLPSALWPFLLTVSNNCVGSFCLSTGAAPLQFIAMGKLPHLFAFGCQLFCLRLPHQSTGETEHEARTS